MEAGLHAQDHIAWNSVVSICEYYHSSQSKAHHKRTKSKSLTHPHCTPFSAFSLGTFALLDLLNPLISASSASSEFLLAAASLWSLVQTLAGGGVGVAAADTVLLEVLLLEGLRLAALRFLAKAAAYLLLVMRTFVRLRLLPLPRQIRFSTSSAAHSVTLWDLRL
jgi:hypothetical protein